MVSVSWVCLLSLALISLVEGIDFKQWKDCKSCLDAGYGWCPIRRICGGFANRNCKGDYTDRSKVEGEEDPPSDHAPPADSDVIELNDKNFASDIAKYPVALVAFVAPWCGHCKSLAPAFEEAATALKKEDSKAVLIRVDATANEATAKEFGVQGFPTIKLFMKGELEEDYEGGRDAFDIADFLRESASETRKPKPKLERVVDFNMAIANTLLKHKVKKQLMVFGNKKTLKALSPELLKAGEMLDAEGPDMMILKLDSTDQELNPVLERFEVKLGTKGPVYRLADTSGEAGLKALKPPADDKDPAHEATAEGFIELCREAWTNKFQRLLRSAGFVPKGLLGKRAKELIGNTFHKHVTDDADNDAIVFFYMPGCGHCESLKKPFKKALKDFPGVKAFTMDGTKNEVENSETAGYPTVYWYPKGDKKNPVVVSARDKKGLKQFFASNHSPPPAQEDEKKDEL